MPAQPERHSFVRNLHRVVIADVQADVQVALKVGVLVAAGFPRAHVARKALERLKRVALELDRDADL
jgi:Flp pilus assembly protein TadB